MPKNNNPSVTDREISLSPPVAIFSCMIGINAASNMESTRYSEITTKSIITRNL
jgi:hypothetical protein